jgi:hypothetical protein
MGKGYSPEQIVRKLRQADGKLAGGAKVPEVAVVKATKPRPDKG